MLLPVETDSFFYQLLKQLPETLFELLGLPAERADSYRFDSVELKKSLRLDGLFLPKTAKLPLYFVEVQFQKSAGFYANLFAKVFCYLHENNPAHDWAAVAIFASRRVEPKHLRPYLELLQSGRVMRVYVDEISFPPDPPLGMGILQLLSVPVEQAKRHVTDLMHKAEREVSDSELAAKVVELLEGLLLRRFPQLDREEVRIMFQLHDIRKSKVWQEAHQTGREEGREEGLEQGLEQGKAQVQKELVQRLLASGMPIREIAALMEMTPKDVRRLAKKTNR